MNFQLRKETVTPKDMAQLNDFMTRIDLSVLNDYVTANGKSVVYARGERIVQQGQLCRYVGVVK